MPKMIGNTIAGCTHVRNNARASEIPDGVAITYAQALLLPPEHVICSLDTSDKGGPRSLAKRWYRWFSTSDDILAAKRSTPNMIARAHARRAHDSRIRAQIRANEPEQTAWLIESGRLAGGSSRLDALIANWQRLGKPADYLEVIRDLAIEEGLLP